MANSSAFFFIEAEVISDAAREAKQPEEPDLTTVKEHTRSRRRITHDVDLPENITVEVIENKLAGDNLKCPLCGEEMVEVGEDIVRRLKLIPAHAVIEETHTKKYACFKVSVKKDPSRRVGSLHVKIVSIAEK